MPSKNRMELTKESGNMSSGMRDLCAAQFSYWLSGIDFDADIAVGSRVA
jgi:hypothetical protein